MDLDKDRFSSLSVPHVLDGFLKAVNGSPVYSVLPEAFLNDTRSLKRDRIDELFSQISLEGGWDWVARNRHVVTFIDQVRGGQNTADAELRTFINYRNEAAHGSVDQVLGVGPLTEYVEFIVSVCRATEELFRWNWIRKGERAGRTKKAGRVTERFKDNIVIAKLTNCRIEQGMNVILLGEDYCYPVTVESIQMNNVQHKDVTVETETEVGLKFDQVSQRHPEIYLEVPMLVDGHA
jgi:hypothetical protein